MKPYVALVLALALCLAAAEPRRKTGGGSGRKTSTNPRRGSTNNGQSSHQDLASLSYPGYSASAKKPAQPAPPRQDSNIGWNVNKQPAAAPSYPSSGGLSGNQAAKPAAASGSHTYPASNPSSGQHTYPGSNPAPGQHSYPASNGASGAGSHSYPSSGGLSGNQKPANPPPYSPANQSPVNQANAKPANSPPAYSPANQAPNQQGGYNHPPPAYNQGGYHPNQPGHGGPPPPYSQGGYGGYGGGYGGMGGGYGGGFGGMGGGYGGYGGLGAYGGGFNPMQYQKKSSFLGGNTFGAILTGLAVWNLVRSGSRSSTVNNNYYYNGQPGGPPGAAGAAGAAGSAELPDIQNDPILQYMENCTLTIMAQEKTDVTLIPCIIVSSFASDPDTVKNLEKAAANAGKDELKCMITIVFKNATESKLNMPCAALSQQAPKNDTMDPNQMAAQQNCTPGAVSEELQPGNPTSCRIIAPTTEHPMEVVPLSTTTTQSPTDSTSSPSSESTTSSPTSESTSSPSSTESASSSSSEDPTSAAPATTPKPAE